MRRRQRLPVALVGSLVLALMPQFAATATLQLLKPLPTDAATFSGHGGYSADGLGQAGVGGTIQAEVPAGSSVVQAYLYGTYFGNLDPSLSDRTIDFDGTDVVLSKLPNSEPGPCCQLTTARAEVTAQVAAKVGSGGGITDFTVNSDPPSLDGVGLVVLFANASLPNVTIAVLDGGSQQTGDTATFNFASPIDPTAPGFSAIMSLGIGFGFQGTNGHDCGFTQFSTVDVNGSRLTSCAGNWDDGYAANGGLITVGGVGDSTDNPANPFAQGTGQDDELYDLVPFLSVGDTALTITTTNPSGDDNLFLAVIEITAEAAVTTEICDDGIDNDGDGLVDDADPDCTVVTPDSTAPLCDLVAVDPGPPTQLRVHVQDTDSGLASIAVTKAVNADVVVPPFAVGSNDLLEVTATKINQSKKAQVELTVTDVAGNTTVCDPVITLEIREEGQPVTNTYTDIPAAEDTVTVYNGDPGIQHLDVTVNGETFRIRALRTGEVRTVDIGSALLPGDENVVTLTAMGKPGGSATVMIWDGN